MLDFFHSKTTAVARFKPNTLDCIQGKSFEEKRLDQFDVKSFLEKTHLFSTKMAPIQKATFSMASAPDHCVQSKVHFPPTNIKSLTSSQNLPETNKTFLKTHQSCPGLKIDINHRGTESILLKLFLVDEFFK